MISPIDSPYRTPADPTDLVTCAGRADRRCTTSGGARCPSRWRVRRVALLLSLLLAALGAALVGGVAFGSLFAGPRGVLLTCAPTPPLHASVRPVSAAALPVARAGGVELPDLPSSLLDATEPQTHDPSVLVERARAMQSAGLPVDITEVALPASAIATLAPTRVNATPVSRGAKAAGVELAMIAPGSILARAGFRPADVVLTINGYSAAGSDWPDHVLANADRGGHAVIELVRHGRRVVVSLRWPCTAR